MNDNESNLYISLIEEELHIPANAVDVVSKNKLSCVVPVKWLSELHRSRRTSFVDVALYKQLNPADVNHLLTASSNATVAGWRRTDIVVIKKSPKLVESLIELPLCLSRNGGWSYAGVKTFLSNERRKCLREDAESRYKSAIQLTCQTGAQQPFIKKYDVFVRDFLSRLYGVEPTKLVESCRSVEPSDDVTTSELSSSPFEPPFSHPGILPAYAVVESAKAFYVMSPSPSFTVADLVMFSPSKLKDESHSTKLFVVYQLLDAVRHLHGNGISVYNMTLKDVVVDDQLWLKVVPPCADILCRRRRDDDVEPVAAATDCLAPPSSSSAGSFSTSLDAAADLDLPTIVQKWVYHEISNFEYLMVLNRLAGRNVGEPNHYPILPWVVDFATPTGNYRDLTKTKYRLNKGDQQLDLTFDVSNPESIMRGAGQIPFHVSDFLSDITYYVYVARRIDKSTLCRHVRSRWVPNHYPASVRRLYEWTPDECIPEFYADPKIFASIHDDLPDLELPPWAKSADDFVRIHRGLLESSYVSENLHHWIDLTFGQKLSGVAAVNSKNVCLQLVDHHKQLLNHGVVQLFACQHPQRYRHTTTLPRTVDPRDERRNEIDARNKTLSSPLMLLDHLESLYEFTTSASNALPPQRAVKEVNERDVLRSLVTRDMQTLGCLIVELFLVPVWALNEPCNDLRQRYERARKLCQTNIKDIPLCIRRGVTYLLNLDEKYENSDVKDGLGEVFIYPSVGFDGLPPPNVDVLLHPSSRLLTFPSYFENLHGCLCRLRSLSADDGPPPEGGNNNASPENNDAAYAKRENQKVSFLMHFLTRTSHALGRDGIALVIPYVEELLRSRVAGVQCAWSLFYPVSQALGPAASVRHLLPALVALFDVEETTVKYLKVYHRSFVNQLIVRLGLDVFLNSFSTLLVEAVSGYKDFDSSSIDGGNVDGFVAEEDIVVANPEASGVVDGDGDSGREEHVELDFFPAENFMTDDVFDGDIGGGRKALTEDEEEEKSLDSVGHASLDGERRQRGNCDSISNGSDGRDATATSDDATDADVRSAGAGNDSDSVGPTEQPPLCITVDSSKMDENNGGSGCNVANVDYNVSNVAAETIKWLAQRLGPVLTAKYVSRNLLRMLALCYVGEDQLMAVDGGGGIFLSTTGYFVNGDQQSHLLLQCLSYIATLYGEHVIVLHYLQHIKELISTYSKSLTVKGEGSLISSLVLLVCIIPCTSDALLMDILQETIFVGILQPMMEIISSSHVSFPSGSLSRRLACFRMIDVLCVISLRIGFEMTRQHMTVPIQRFFEGFSRAHERRSSPEIGAFSSSDVGASSADLHSQMKKDDVQLSSVPLSDGTGTHDGDMYYEVRMNLQTSQYTVDTTTTSKHKRQSSLGSIKQHSLSPPLCANNTDEGILNPDAANRDRISQELLETYTPELAHAAYIPFCKLAGGIHIEQNLSNDDLIRHLCSRHDASLMSGQTVNAASFVQPASSTGCGKTRSSTHVNANATDDIVVVEGNKIVIKRETSSDVVDQSFLRSNSSCGMHLSTDSNALRNPEMKADTRRHLKSNWLAYWEHEIGLSDRVRDFNLKQIKLQSFQGHSGAVRDLIILDNENSFISSGKDRTVKLWSLRNYGDGTAKVGCQFTYAKHKKSVNMISFIDSIRLIASCDGSIHIWDPFMGMNVRQINTGKSFSVNVMCALPAPSSTILTASSDSILRFIDARCGRFTHQFKTTIVPAGTIRSTAVSQDGQYVAVGYSTGIAASLDLRTGYLLSTWKAHEAEILQMKTFGRRRFVTSAIDQTVSVWQHDDGKLVASVKGFSDPAHWLSFYKDTLVSAAASNKVFIGSCLETTAEVSCTKLKSDILRGALSSLTVLPLNRLLLIGSDHGDIILLA